MRALNYVEPKAEDKPVFKFSDISNVLFNSQPVILTVHPFRASNFSLIRQLSFDIQLVSIDVNTNLLDTLANIVLKINNRFVTENTFYLLYPWMFLPIIKEVYKQLDRWYVYVIENMDEFCDTTESIMNWQVVKTSGIDGIFIERPLKFEQRYWISTNVMQDRKNLYKYIDNIRESLLPWLNSKLYHAYIEKRDNTRINVNYEDTRLKLLAQAENLQQNKIDKRNTKFRADIDLDIIE